MPQILHSWSRNRNSVTSRIYELGKQKALLPVTVVLYQVYILIFSSDIALGITAVRAVGFETTAVQRVRSYGL